MSKIIAVLNQKGGVGKTTTVINVGYFLAKKGKKVLIVDLDPQANSTSGLGLVGPEATKNSDLYGVLMDEEGASKSIIELKPNLHILPSSRTLSQAEVSMASVIGREFLLKKALGGLKNFDIILVDCPPSLGLLTVNALTASDSVLIPVQAEYYAMEGLGQLLETVRQVRAALNPSLEVLGIIITMFDNRTTLSENVKNELYAHFPGKIFKSTIPRNVRLAEAPSYGLPIGEYDKWSKGSRAYQKLTKELLDRL